MKPIGIGEMSPKQVSRLRNGHKVRVGCGLGQLMVHPERYDTMDKTFKKGKKMTIQLSPEELSANRSMSGEGIFGKQFDKFLGKIGIKKQVYQFGDMIKNPVKKAIRTIADKAPLALGTAGATLATAVGQPELAGLAMMAGKKLGEKARNYSRKHIEGYIDDPDAYQKNPSKFGDFKGVGLYASGRGMCVPGGDGLYASARGRGMMGCGHPAMASQASDQQFHQRYQLGGRGLYA